MEKAKGEKRRRRERERERENACLGRPFKGCLKGVIGEFP